MKNVKSFHNNDDNEDFFSILGEMEEEEEEEEEEEFFVSDKYLAIRKCIQCKLHYNEIDNIGRLQCRIHPGLRLCDHEKRDFYSCCGIYTDAYTNGHITAMDMAGCVTIDHMDETFLPNGAKELTKNQLNARLCQIKAFSVAVVPKEMIRLCNVIQPSRSTILFNYNGGFDRLPLSPTIEHNLDIFRETRQNHELLASEHNPYTYGPSFIAPRIENTNRFNSITKQDSISVDIHAIAMTMDKQALLISSSKKKKVASGQDGWPDVTIKKMDGGDEDDGGTSALLRGRKSEGAAFMVIRRIDDKLNILPVHSKLDRC